MLIASYVVGYDQFERVGHLGVDKVFPADMDRSHYELCSSGESGSRRHDLLIFFPNASIPVEVICLPNLPELVVETMNTGTQLPVVDFSNGRVIRVSGLAAQRLQCA
ncbi:hypothetical protein I6N98_08510 [Spongiibacter nanhainus]|uniref:Uncharacterized protein n=1 Tax=Spongiibacter nanhainus TaxID=2794344 RepID=A0A7T4R3Z3_9GAMM|nr:hypothetical protein [Spongiibacter nanhainus]QQD19860.1 hypothetical protein I6N98_08510 [Spongiibacter nanhainus]